MATTSLNPGVGPTNADIATAVAAPSSATIATAVAAAVPTIGAINTSVANNAPSPNAWVHLGTGTLQNVSTATVSFSAYRKLKILIKGVTNTSLAQTPVIRLNGDTSSNYNIGWSYDASGQTSRQHSANLGTTSIALYQRNAGSGVSANFEFLYTMEVENANLTNPKNYRFEGYERDGANSQYALLNGSGFYVGTSAITSITLVDLGNNLFANTTINTGAIQVFGMN